MGLCFAMFVFLTFRGPLASHNSNPYPHRSRIARYNATKLKVADAFLIQMVVLVERNKRKSKRGDNNDFSLRLWEL